MKTLKQLPNFFQGKRKQAIELGIKNFNKKAKLEFLLNHFILKEDLDWILWIWLVLAFKENDKKVIEKYKELIKTKALLK